MPGDETVPVREFYRGAGYLELTERLTPAESGWGGVVEGHEDCDAVKGLQDVWGSASAIGWHDDHHLLMLDFDFSKAPDGHSVDDLGFKQSLMDMYPGQEERLHIIESKTPGNVHIPILVEGLDEASAIQSKFSWIDVKGSADAAAPSWTVSVFTEGYSFFWRDRIGRDQYHPLGSETAEEEAVPVLDPGTAVRAVTMDGERVAEICGREEDDGGSRPEDIDVHSPLEPADVVGGPTGTNREHPFHGSSTGANFMIDEGSSTWACWSARHDHVTGNVTGNAYHLVAMDAGILECGEWMEHDEAYAGKREEILAECEERGLSVPEHWRLGEYHAEFEAAAGLLEELRDTGGDTGLLWDIRTDTKRQFRLAAEQEVSGHFVAPKGAGKTHGSVSLASIDGNQVVEVAPTREKYDEIIEEAEEQDVDVLRLPSFPEHSELYDLWEDEYHAGAMPREIYSWADGDVEDEYTLRSDEDFSEYDLLVGAPAHLHLDTVVEGRIVCIDDCDMMTFSEEFRPADHGASINSLLERSGSRYDSYQQLERDGSWDELRREVASWLEDEQPGRSDPMDARTIGEALNELMEEPSDGNVDRLEFLRRTGLDLGTLDWARVLCGDTEYNERVATFEHDGEAQRVLVRAPDLSDARQVLTMSAWPAVDELEALFDDFNVEYDGLFGVGRHDEMEEALNRVVVRTSQAQNCKSATGRAHDPERVEGIAADLKWKVGARLGIGEDPEVFTTKAEASEIEGAVNYASLTGTNEYGGHHLAVAGGAQHFGDEYVKMRAAVAGITPGEPTREGFKPASWGNPSLQRIDSRMRQEGVYEAATRLGRDDGDLTVVAADTAAVPDWMRVVDVEAGRLSGAERAVYDVVAWADGPMQVKDAEGTGIVDLVDYSAVRLYEAKDSLMDRGWLIEAGEGKWGAEKVDTSDDSVSSGIESYNTRELTGRFLSGASSPDWDIQRLAPGPESDVDPGQTTLADIPAAD